MTLRIATYNIHGCIGRDGRRDPGRVRAVLRALNADVIALQEVHVADAEPGLLEFLTADSRWQPVHGPTLERSGGQYGNVVLTALPIRSMERIDISQPGREPRGALFLSLTAAGLQLDLLATHLGLQPAERRAQILLLLDELQSREQRDPESDCTVLAGDLNEWLAWGRPLRWLQTHFGPSETPATWPAHRPLFALDRIWVKPRSVLVRTKAVRSQLARQASDHLPLVTELDLGIAQKPSQ